MPYPFHGSSWDSCGCAQCVRFYIFRDQVWYRVEVPHTFLRPLLHHFLRFLPRELVEIILSYMPDGIMFWSDDRFLAALAEVGPVPATWLIKASVEWMGLESITLIGDAENPSDVRLFACDYWHEDDRPIVCAHGREVRYEGNAYGAFLACCKRKLLRHWKQIQRRRRHAARRNVRAKRVHREVHAMKRWARRIN